MKTCDVRIKRIYDKPASADGWRVLVDRLWPRGIRKADAKLDEWARDLAPSTALRKWFDHDPRHWEEFGRRYRKELKTCGAQLEGLRERASKGRVTLLYAARDPELNHALVLQAVIAKKA